jgi:cholesterol transport system auxiliary component
VSEPSQNLLSRRAALALLAVSVTGMSACGRAAPTTFDLSAPREGLTRSHGRAILIVPEPVAIFALDSERIVIRAANGELSYLSNAQWSDRMPRLVQARVVQTFENRGRAAVGRPGDRLAGALTLLLDVRVFEVREMERAAAIEVAAKLVGAGSGSVRAARLFGASAPVGAIDGPGVTAAMDQALARVLTDLTGWASALG